MGLRERNPNCPTRTRYFITYSICIYADTGEIVTTVAYNCVKVADCLLSVAHLQGITSIANTVIIIIYYVPIPIPQESHSLFAMFAICIRAVRLMR